MVLRRNRDWVSDDGGLDGGLDVEVFELVGAGIEYDYARVLGTKQVTTEDCMKSSMLQE